MDGLLDLQTSRNDWSAPPAGTLQGLQEASAPWHAGDQSSILQDFEVQIMQYEREYADHLRRLAELYVVPTDGSVAEFLDDHRALPQILIAALPNLRKYFPGAVLALRASSDEFGWENLYVDVLWPGDAMVAFRLLEKFGTDWWLANARLARGALTFTYRLV